MFVITKYILVALALLGLNLISDPPIKPLFSMGQMRPLVACLTAYLMFSKKREGKSWWGATLFFLIVFGGTVLMNLFGLMPFDQADSVNFGLIAGFFVGCLHSVFRR
jgi:hypothetical protein